MTSKRSVEDVVDAADRWHHFGTEYPKEEIVFFARSLSCTRSLWSASNKIKQDLTRLPSKEHLRWQ